MTIGSAIATGISLIPYPIPAKDGFIAYLVIQAVLLVYAFSPNDYSVRKQILLTAVILFPGISMGLDLTKYSGSIVAELACIVSVATFLFILLKDKETFKDEIGFLSVPFAHSVIRLMIAITVLKG